MDNTENEVKEPIELTIEGIQEDLKNGISRTDMIEKYGVKKADINRIFKHPDLKGKKVHTAANGKGSHKSRLGKASFILRDAAGKDITNTVHKVVNKSKAELDESANVATETNKDGTNEPQVASQGSGAGTW